MGFANQHARKEVPNETQRFALRSPTKVSGSRFGFGDQHTSLFFRDILEGRGQSRLVQCANFLPRDTMTNLENPGMSKSR